jgi:hypothetical protein
MKTNVTSQPSEIFLKKRKYIFLLVFFLIIIVVLAVTNPGKIFSNYLYATLPIIIFFMAFLISMLFLYNRDPADLTPININVNNWFLKAVVIFMQFSALIAFTYWIVSAFGNKTFEDISKNTYGDRFAIVFNIFVLISIFIISSLNFGENGKLSIIALGAISLLFLVLFIIFKATNSDGGKYVQAPIIFFYSIICLGFLLIFNNSKDFIITTTNEQIINNYFSKALMFLLGSGVSALFIYWIVTTIGKLDSKSSIISFVLNILIVITILGLAYKAFTAGKIFQSSPIVSLFINILLYIPCIFVNIIELLASPFGGFKGSVLPSFSLKQEYQNTTRGSVIMLGIAISLLAIYFSFPYIKNKNVLQGGNQLLNDPVYSNSERVLGSYGTLNGSDNFNYQYAISFWFYIDSSAPSTNASYLKYTSLLNYGNKPNVKYNATTNTLMIVEDQTGGPPSTCPDFKISTDDVDENGMRIIYKRKDVLLQKWNNVIINYTGGTLDIFYNGELVKSSVEVIPYMKLDNLSIGQNSGLNGGICNVIYFKKPLTATQVYYIYNSVKNKTPPTLYESNFSVLQDQFNIAGEGDDIINSKIQKEVESSVSSINIPSVSVPSINIPSTNLGFKFPSMSRPSISAPSISGPSIPSAPSIPSTPSIPSDVPSQYQSQIPSGAQDKIPQGYQSQIPSGGQYKIPQEYQSQVPSKYQSQIPSEYK